MRQKKSRTKSSAPGGGGQARAAAGEAADAGPMSVGFLQQLVSLMTTHDLSIVELREGEKRIKLQRGAAAPQYIMSAPAMGSGPAAMPAQSTSPIVSAGGAAAAARDEDAGTIAIKSPMVGTFYSSPSPDARPFVSVGTQVDEETDVCIIEAMKVFNNIKAECRGTITKIMVSNGQTVEFGTVLFLVKPS